MLLKTFPFLLLFSLALPFVQAEVDVSIPDGAPLERPEVDKGQLLEGGLSSGATGSAREPERSFLFPSVDDVGKTKDVFQGEYGDEFDRSMPQPLTPRKKVDLSQNPSISFGDASSERSLEEEASRKGLSWGTIFSGFFLVGGLIAGLLFVLSRPAKSASVVREKEEL